MTINLAAIESRNEERRRLRDAATPGPWWRIDPPWGYGDTVHAGNTDDPHGARAFICTSVPMEDDLCESSNVSDDMALIAYARTDTAPEDIAALVAEVRRLEGERAEMNAVIRKQSERIRELLGELDALRLVEALRDTEIEKLKIALADAIRRPMGTWPDSAMGMITVQDVDAAEFRRVHGSTNPTTTTSE